MTTARKLGSIPVEAPPPHNGFSLISNDKLLQLYSTVLKCRMVEERIRTLHTRNGSFDLRAAMNQDAAAVGVVLDLLPGDTLAPSPHGFIPCFVRGLPLDNVFSAFVNGSSRPRIRYASLNLVPPSLSLGAQLDRAIAAAIANMAAKNQKIVAVFCGNSKGSPELLHDSMRQAGKRKLPILLVCHSDPDSEEIGRQAQDCGFPGVTVDGDDVVAVYRVSTEAMTHARRGNGPTLIECKPWVLSGRSSSRRSTAGNPVLRMEEYLAGKGLFDRKLKSRIAASFRRELDAALKVT